MFIRKLLLAILLIPVALLVIAGVAAAQVNETAPTPTETNLQVLPTGPNVDPAESDFENLTSISIYKHLCRENIQDPDVFDALSSLGEKTLVCPSVVRPGQEAATGTLQNFALSYDFDIKVIDDLDQINTYDRPTYYRQEKTCEPEFGYDIDGDDEISANTCLDTSHYIYTNIPQGFTAIYEKNPASATRLGAIETVPSANNEDEDLELYQKLGVIYLGTTKDDDDKVLVHAYNFQGEVGAGLAQPIVTQVESELQKLRTDKNQATTDNSVTNGNIPQWRAILSTIRQLIETLIELA